jgi:anti-anti-sigma factor
MSLSIEVRCVEHIVIIELTGRVSVVDLGLKQFAAGLIERGHRHFIVNLANVSYLDNFGLGQLCWLYTVARNRGGDLKLLHPTPRIRKLLGVTKLDLIFESYESEREAVGSMGIPSTPLKVSANGY